MGENIRLARLRRKLSMALVAERAGTSVPTLRAIEQRAPSMAIGSYATVLPVIGMKDELSHVAADDELGRFLQDQGLEPKKRAPQTDHSRNDFRVTIITAVKCFALPSASPPFFDLG